MGEGRARSTWSDSGGFLPFFPPATLEPPFIAFLIFAMTQPTPTLHTYRYLEVLIGT